VLRSSRVAAVDEGHGEFRIEPDRLAEPCPLWVKSRHVQCTNACPLYPNSDRKSGRHSKDNAHAVDQALGDLPLSDRIFALTACIVTRKPESLRGTVAVTAVTTAMEQHLSEAERVAISEILRDAAEHRQLERV
jgi:hypothetical protein